MTSTPPGSTPAGWYPDTNQPGMLRYWDGNAWTEHTHRADAGSGSSFGQAQAVPQSTAPPSPGWYPESGNPSILRYWDGTRWTEHTHEAAAAAGYQIYRPGMSADPGIVGTDGRYRINGLPVCTPGQRLGAYVLDSLLILVTLVIGWIVWACITAQKGQTPGRKLLNQRVYRFPEMNVASFGWMLGMRGIVAGIVWALLSIFWIPVLVLIFMPFWDRKNQTVTDKVSTCVVLAE